MNFTEFLTTNERFTSPNRELIEYLNDRPTLYKVAMDCGGSSCNSSSGSHSYSSLGGHFKEEDHPRGKKGEKDGGKFVKSNKTIAKEDDLGSPSDKGDKERDSARRDNDSSMSPKVAAKIETVKNMHKEYKKRLDSLMDYAGKMHGGFTEVAMSLSRFREKMKKEIRSLSDYGYELSGSLTGDISFKKTGGGTRPSNGSSSNSAKSVHYKPTVSHSSGGSCAGSC